MKKILLFSIILVLIYQQSNAQKLDSILSKSKMSFNYGLSHDFFAKTPVSGGPANALDFKDRDQWGQIFGFEYSYRFKGKNELGFGFSRQAHRREYNEEVQTSLALIRFEGIVLRNTKNFHSIHWKRHLIENKLLATVGLYNLRYRDQRVGILGNSDQTIVNIIESGINIEFGIFLGLEYYHDIRNFQVGLRSRLYYSQGAGLDSFESFEFTPVLRFKL